MDVQTTVQGNTSQHSSSPRTVLQNGSTFKESSENFEIAKGKQNGYSKVKVDGKASKRESKFKVTAILLEKKQCGEYQKADLLTFV